VGQVDPAPVHTLLTQQPPPVQVLSAQQGSPGPPHWAHTPVPAPLQTVAASWQLRPGQQV
jgi:hypothetical protein